MSAVGRQYYQHPHVPIVVSSGDSGFTTELSGRAAVGRRGGRHHAHPGQLRRPRLHRKGLAVRRIGVLCYVSKPAWQHDTHCRMRTIADVAAVGDNFAVYDSAIPSSTGWIEVGGTSLSAPLIAAMIARSARPSLDSAAYLYAHHPLSSTSPGLERSLRWRLPLHRQAGVRRSDRRGHAERPRRALIRPRAAPKLRRIG